MAGSSSPGRRLPCVIVHSPLRLHIPLTVCFSTGLLSFIVPPSLAPSGAHIWLGVVALVLSVLNPLSGSISCSSLQPSSKSNKSQTKFNATLKVTADFSFLERRFSPFEYNIHNMKGNAACNTNSPWHRESVQMEGGVEMRAGRREEKEKESIENTQILP